MLKPSIKDGEIKLKNEKLGYLYCWIVTGSMILNGYSLTMLSASNLNDIKTYYDINLSKSLILSIINGSYALGGLLGCLISSYLGKIPTKRRYYIFMLMVVISSGLSLIPLLGTLCLSRFILGLAIAFSMGLAGAYIRQSFSQRLRRVFGAIYSLQKIIGTEICYILGFILKKNNFSNSHLIVFCGCGILALILMILVFVFVPEIPLQMLMHKKFDRFNALMFELYNQEDIPRKIKEIQKQQQQMKTIPNFLDRQTRNRLITALNCAFIRQFCGATYVIVYSVYIFTSLKSPYTDIATLIINSVQVVAGFIGLWVVSTIKRSKLVIIGTILGAVLSFFIAVGDGIGSSALSLAAMILYMMPTASCLQSVTWFYPYDCAPYMYTKYASFVSWFGTACLLIIPPFLSDYPSYPLFIFFGVYLCLTIYINNNYFVSLDKKEVDVKKEKVAIELTFMTDRTKIAQQRIL